TSTSGSYLNSKLASRKFVDIDRETFDEVLAGMEPRLQLTTSAALDGEDRELKVDVRFKRLEDFEPESIVGQVPFLNKLWQVRRHLANLKSHLDLVADFLDRIWADAEVRKGVSAAAIGRALDEALPFSLRFAVRKALKLGLKEYLKLSG